MKSDQKVDRIMAFRTGKAQEQRKVNLQGTVMSGQMEKCISIIVFIQVAVPAPGSIGVGIMAGGKDLSGVLWGKRGYVLRYRRRKQ